MSIKKTDTANIEVKTNLKDIRIKKNVSQSDIANAIGVARATINRIETGNTSATNIKVALLLAKYFDKTVEDIFFIEL